MVLIESDWNLKPYKPISDTMVSPCINRIRLEFKGRYLINLLHHGTRINRIRLEFKGQQISFQSSYT